MIEGRIKDAVSCGRRLGVFEAGRPLGSQHMNSSRQRAGLRKAGMNNW